MDDDEVWIDFDIAIAQLRERLTIAEVGSNDVLMSLLRPETGRGQFVHRGERRKARKFSSRRSPGPAPCIFVHRAFGSSPSVCPRIPARGHGWGGGKDPTPRVQE